MTLKKWTDWNWDIFSGSAVGLKWNRRDLPNLDYVMRMVPGRSVVVQGGGNLGIFPKRLAQEFEAVYSFEPDPFCFLAMVYNAPEPNIIKIQAALGCERQRVSTCTERRDGKPLDHEGITHIKGTGIIPTILIDDLALPVCDLIYLDLEGYELYALRGAVETIKRCRPVLAIEINKSLAFIGLTKTEVKNLILSFGYKFVVKLSSDEIFVPVEMKVEDQARI